jgi:6-phosphogluconolactonase (cycloisomerase 2 family)
MHPSRGFFARIAIALGVLAIAASAAAGAAVLVSKGFYTDGVGGVTGLQGVRMVIVSPDSKNVYTAAEGQSAITVWSRAHDGSLKEIQVIKDKVGGVTGLNFVDNLSISPDGKNVYAAGITSKTFVTFARDSAGKLTEVQVLKNGVDVPAGLNGVIFNSTSSDGKNVYAAATLDNALVVFSRRKSNGLLTPIQVLQSGVGGVTGLKGVFPVIVSRDGKNVYAGARTDHTVLVYSRASNGKLTLVQTLTEGVGGVKGIDGARYILESFEGDTIYVAGLAHNTIAVLHRDSAGKLTEIQTIIWKVNATGLAQPVALAESFDHLHLFAASFGDFGLDSFHRDRVSGKLTTQEQDTEDPGDGSLGLLQVISIAMSAGGQNLYSAGYFSGTLGVWQITEKSHEPFGDPGEPAESAVSPDGAAPAPADAAVDGNPPN